MVDTAVRNARRDPEIPRQSPTHCQVWLSYGADRQSAIQKLQSVKTRRELLEDMQLFAHDVIPPFAESR